MPHIDEGTLHALLDGALDAGDPGAAGAARAHLEACADCRARLDAAAELTRRASGILAAAGPDTRPDFDEVLVRAGHLPTADPLDPDRHARRLRAVRRTRAIAWAATIVLALGTGYLIRDLVGPEPVPLESSQAADPEAALDLGPAPDVAPPEPERAASDRVLPETAPTAAPRREARPADAGPTGTADAATVQRATPERTAAPGPVPAGALPPPAAALRADEAAPFRADEAAPFRAAGAAGAAGAPARLEEHARAVGVTEAVDLAGGILYVLPGAVVLEAAVLGAGEAAVVRTVQRTDAGAEIMVTQRSADAVRADTGEAEDAVVVFRGEHLLVLEGPLAADALRALGEAAQPLGRRPDD